MTIRADATSTSTITSSLLSSYWPFFHRFVVVKVSRPQSQRNKNNNAANYPIIRLRYATQLKIHETSLSLVFLHSMGGVVNSTATDMQGRQDRPICRVDLQLHQANLPLTTAALAGL